MSTKTINLTTEQVAAELRCEQPHVRRLIREGMLPAVNISPGSKRPTFRVDANDLGAFMASNKQMKHKRGGKKRTRGSGEVSSYV